MVITKHGLKSLCALCGATCLLAYHGRSGFGGVSELFGPDPYAMQLSIARMSSSLSHSST
jgi:hypothetical protein